MINIHPTFAYLAAAALMPLFVGSWRNRMLIAVAGLALLTVYMLPEGASVGASFLGFDLTLLRVDKLSKVFGYVFTLNSVIAFVYGYHLKDGRQQLATLFYIGASLGAVFAGDLITLYIFWEVMAVASTFLILARQTPQAYAAGFRYILIHLFGGLVLLLGIIMFIKGTGTTGFSAISPDAPGSWLMLIGVLINASAFPLGSWLPDSYPEATVTGGVILSAYTTKTAVYVLLRGFPGWEILIAVGCFMAIYGVVYALMENDIRRILAYSITNQVGFMLIGAGIGTAVSINGAAAHAFCHIIYKSLLWMSAGAVLAMTGKSKCTDLEGIRRFMPWTFALGLIGALSILGFPGTNGFASKTLILNAVAHEHMSWVLIILEAAVIGEVAAMGIFLLSGIKFPTPLGKVGKSVITDPPKHMLLAMGTMAVLCIGLGTMPEILYSILPFDTEGFTPYKLGKVVGQFQLLTFSALVFFLMLPLLKRTDTMSLEVDWLYRRGGRLFYRVMDRCLNPLNAAVDTGAARTVGRFAGFCRDLPVRIVSMIVSVAAPAGEQSVVRRQNVAEAMQTGTFPVGGTILAVTVGLGVMLALVL
jgi:multicomponent Na+:H+ antiporter subunit D